MKQEIIQRFALRDLRTLAKLGCLTSHGIPPLFTKTNPGNLELKILQIEKWEKQRARAILDYVLKPLKSPWVQKIMCQYIGVGGSSTRRFSSPTPCTTRRSTGKGATSSGTAWSTNA